MPKSIEVGNITASNVIPEVLNPNDTNDINPISGGDEKVPITKSILMSIPQVIPHDDSEVQPTKVVSIFHLFVFNVSYIYSQ
jgi:hypothetical protein